jgi:streptomycin 6-kinase
MIEDTFNLPELVRRKALLRGEAGVFWLAGLRELVRELERKWHIRVRQTMGGGTESLVLASARDDGEPVVLKIGLPGVDGLENEARVLRLANGVGYARLLEYNNSRNAMLLERLGDQLINLGLTVRNQIALICETLDSAWLKLDGPNGFMTGAQKARSLADFIMLTWTELNQPCDAAIIDQATAFAEEREHAYNPMSSVLVHGDAHPWNTLRRLDRTSSPTSFKFIDPDGIFVEPAYDLAISMREWDDELLAGDILSRSRARCTFLHELTGVDDAAIWQWGFIERVSSGLLLLRLGQTSAGMQHLSIAQEWLAA